VSLYLGDCRDVLLDLTYADLIVTDPPYGFERFETDTKDYLMQVGPALRIAFTLIRTGGAMFAFCSTAEIVRLANAINQPLKRVLWMYKPNDCTFPLAGWLLTSEAILWFQNGAVSTLAERRPYRHDCYVVTTVGQEGVEGHPTVKPLEVIKDLVSRCPEGGTVLDQFAGSGTTLLAAKKFGRKAIGIEIEGKYCEIAARRLAQEVLL
jgi:site-specific DNA-methyltransferase (adenine-specific)